VNSCPNDKSAIAEPLRVLHVLGELRASGAERMLCSAAPHWRRHSIDCSIVSLGAVPGLYAQTLCQAGYPIDQLPVTSTLASLARWARFIKKHPVDVVHFHAERAYFWLCAVTLLRSRSGVVRSFHAAFPFRGNLRLRRSMQRRLLRRKRVRNVAISASVQKVEQDRFRNPTLLIPNWFDSSVLARVDEEKRRLARLRLGLQTQFVVAVIGNCAPVKNHGALFRAIAGPPVMEDTVVLHVGDEGSENERAMVASLGIQHYIRFLGMIDDVGMVLHAADVFCMPSLREGFGIAAAEAIGVGVPTVLANVNGLSDFAGSFESITYASPTAESIREALNVVRSRITELSSQAAADACLARELFSVEQGVARYSQLYWELCRSILRTGACGVAGNDR
jgi:glycosyltransferase involved in cell wall biosynthesis